VHRVTGRAALETELLHWMREEPLRRDDARFSRIALDLFRYQFEHCAPYRRFCTGRGITPETLRSWQEIPAAPAAAFKEVALRCFPEEATRQVFRTSGSSGRRRGRLALDTLALYEASLVPSFEAGVLGDLAPSQPVRLLVLAPDPQEAPDSSLSYMFAVLCAQRGAAGSGFFVREGALDIPALEAACREPGPPLALCGTAFAFVHWLDSLAQRGALLALPAGARLMETGGFKGRARERSREALYAELEARLGIPEARIVNQYGMTELASQFYDQVLRRPDAPRHKSVPPWARVRILDPERGSEQPLGTPGMIHVMDLANTGSVASVQTADLGRELPGGFEVLGRAPGAEARGCSIAADEMLGGTH